MADEASWRAIPESGEVEITLDRIYPMRPSRRVMKAIETGTGRSLQSLIFSCGTGREGLTSSEQEVIVTEGIKAAGKERNDPMLMGVKQEKIGELLYEAGLLKSVDALSSFLMNLASGGIDPTKKAQAAGGSTEIPSQ